MFTIHKQHDVRARYKQCEQLSYTTPCYTKVLYTSCKLQTTHNIQW